MTTSLRPATQEEFAAFVRTLPHEACEFVSTEFPKASYALWMKDGVCVAKATYLPAMDGEAGIKSYEVAE